jgi:hypothetical protein
VTHAEVRPATHGAGIDEPGCRWEAGFGSHLVAHPMERDLPGTGARAVWREVAPGRRNRSGRVTPTIAAREGRWRE